MIPDMTFGSVQNYANPTMSDGTPYFNQNTIYSFIDNMSKIYGSHVFKMGIYFEHTQKIQSARGDRGSFTSTPTLTIRTDTNNSYANALLGYYDSYQKPLRAAIQLPFHQHGMVFAGRLEGEERPVD